MSEEIKESINEIQGIVDFYELDDENNYDYSDKVLISMRNLLDYIDNLQQKVEQLENIRKEAIKIIEEDILGKKIENVNWDYDECYYSDMSVERFKPLLNILNKGDNNGK